MFKEIVFFFRGGFFFILVCVRIFVSVNFCFFFGEVSYSGLGMVR